MGETFKLEKHFLSLSLNPIRLKNSWKINKPEKEVSC